jgi:hypothetical protein
VNVAELFLIAMAIVFTISWLIWLAVVAPARLASRHG